MSKTTPRETVEQTIKPLGGSTAGVDAEDVITGDYLNGIKSMAKEERDRASLYWATIYLTQHSFPAILHA
jgi:hypothetical protein